MATATATSSGSSNEDNSARSQFPPNSKRIRLKILWRQVPPNLKKNPPLNSVEAVPAESQIKSPPKFCGGMYVVPPAILQIMEDPQISKRIHP